jgi:hypothetical protein
MKTQRLALALTIVNLVLLTFQLIRVRPATAAAAQQDVAPVLRGRSLEIVDEQGRVRSQILITKPTTTDGKHYPEGALFRLIDPNGRPAVKIGGSADGSGISLAGDSEKRDWSGIQILSDGPTVSLKLTNRDGRVEVITPQ